MEDVKENVIELAGNVLLRNKQDRAFINDCCISVGVWHSSFSAT